MNRHFLIVPTVLILLFSASAHSQKVTLEDRKKWWNDGNAAEMCSNTQINLFNKFLQQTDKSKNKKIRDFIEIRIRNCENKDQKYAYQIISTLKASSFELLREGLNKFPPPSPLSNGRDYKIVKKITDKLGVPAINVYNMPGLRDAFTVKPVPVEKPVFEADPQFKGIVVDTKFMDEKIDASKKEIADDIAKGKDVLSFIEHGRQRRFGILAHEVAHMLLPVDLHYFYADNVQKKDIQVPNARIQRVLENVHDAISMGKFNRSYGMNWQFVNEMTADYVAGGILAYMEVSEEGLVYLLKMYDATGGSGDVTHLRAKERIKILKMGYEARSVE
jgi:hypothetical protein